MLGLVQRTRRHPLPVPHTARFGSRFDSRFDWSGRSHHPNTRSSLGWCSRRLARQCCAAMACSGLSRSRSSSPHNRRSGRWRSRSSHRSQAGPGRCHRHTFAGPHTGELWHMACQGPRERDICRRSRRPAQARSRRSPSMAAPLARVARRLHNESCAQRVHNGCSRIGHRSCTLDHRRALPARAGRLRASYFRAEVRRPGCPERPNSQLHPLRSLPRRGARSCQGKCAWCV